MPIAYIDIRFFAHATEDENKVVQATHRILPTSHVDEILFKRNSLRGHYSNPITFFEARIKRREVIEAFMKNLFTGLRNVDKRVLLNEIRLHTEEGNLYIRLDKQAAYQEEFKLCTVDPIRVRIRFRKKKLEEITEVCRRMGILP